MTKPDVYYEEEIDASVQIDHPWNVILYNDDVHSLEEVISQVQKATGASLENAIAITLEAHASGRAICFSGSLEECNKVANILKEIRLHVEVDHPAAI
ncbi:MAG TPA: ATP-dependent Clp protease adaptor ClpS [Nitrospiria bacterium]|nr:ATP-dependent Clp protease adaptor ClpS [Nitrospiria bacterium]